MSYWVNKGIITWVIIISGFRSDLDSGLGVIVLLTALVSFLGVLLVVFVLASLAGEHREATVARTTSAPRVASR